ncbi:MAG: hypothetical protein LBQ81_10710 [Zoogloeaceae bacterium]|jgi:hypothetical protein|nr:hypothetical protein [Zoogloeaceae bacterium]
MSGLSTVEMSALMIGTGSKDAGTDHPWRQPRSPFSSYAFSINTGHFHLAQNRTFLLCLQRQTPRPADDTLAAHRVGRLLTNRPVPTDWVGRFLRTRRKVNNGGFFDPTLVSTFAPRNTATVSTMPPCHNRRDTLSPEVQFCPQSVRRKAPVTALFSDS